MIDTAYQQKPATSRRERLMTGYITCHNAIASEILEGSRMDWPQDPTFDWLGSGFYFWEHEPALASHWAAASALHRSHAISSISGLTIIGAVIDPGYCLDLDEIGAAMQVQDCHQAMRSSFSANNDALPVNRLPGRMDPAAPARLKRNQAVVDFLHHRRQAEGVRPYDTVRGPAKPGLLPGGGRTGATTCASLICVRNPAASIHGFFRPLA